MDITVVAVRKRMLERYIEENYDEFENAIKDIHAGFSVADMEMAIELENRLKNDGWECEIIDTAGEAPYVSFWKP